MIEVYLYGGLKDKVEEKIENANRIMLFEFIEGESLQDCLNRLGLKPTDVGDCYINGTSASFDDELHNRDSLELNPIEKPGSI
ncbi:MAG: hypothetical protein ACFFEF_09715 [Candidatus Thorarchaeota archaeon]